MDVRPKLFLEIRDRHFAAAIIEMKTAIPPVNGSGDFRPDFYYRLCSDIIKKICGWEANSAPGGSDHITEKLLLDRKILIH